ncbi:MAG TPA: type II CAAX endopeptidase family protein [Solirubrobacterales bacterium]
MSQAPSSDPVLGPAQPKPSWIKGPAGSPATSASWGPGRVLIGVGLLIFVITIAASIVYGIEGDDDTLAGRLSLQAALALGMAAIAFIAATPNLRPASPRQLGLGPALDAPIRAAAAAYFAYLGSAIVLSVLLSPEQEDVTRELGWGEGTFANVAAAFLIIVAAPISEELFFRGFMFAGIRARAGFAMAAVISGGIWGLVHYTGPDSWPVVLQLTIFGVILAWLYERTGSIRPAIAVHGINNALAFWVLTTG